MLLVFITGLMIGVLIGIYSNRKYKVQVSIWEERQRFRETKIPKVIRHGELKIESKRVTRI